MEKCIKTAAVYIAILKSIYTISQQNHWKCKGSAFYSSHLLFERIYKSAQENLDQSAEKFIGLFGDKVVSDNIQSKLVKQITSKYSNVEPFNQTLNIIKDFLKYSKFAYDCFEQEQKLSLGLDDMLMSIANDQETNIYLIQQSMKK